MLKGKIVYVSGDKKEALREKQGTYEEIEAFFRKYSNVTMYANVCPVIEPKSQE